MYFRNILTMWAEVFTIYMGGKGKQFVSFGVINTAAVFLVMKRSNGLFF